MEDLRPLIESICAEGLGDMLQKGMQTAKGALGLGKETQDAGMFSRDEWGRILQLASKQVNTLANPVGGVKDALLLVNDILNIIKDDPALRMKVAKVHRGFRDALKNYQTDNDSQPLLRLIGQIRSEADKVRSARGGEAKGRAEDVVGDIANTMIEDIRFNNGNLI